MANCMRPKAIALSRGSTQRRINSILPTSDVECTKTKMENSTMYHTKLLHWLSQTPIRTVDCSVCTSDHGVDIQEHSVNYKQKVKIGLVLGVTVCLTKSIVTKERWAQQLCSNAGCDRKTSHILNANNILWKVKCKSILISRAYIAVFTVKLHLIAF